MNYIYRFGCYTGPDNSRTGHRVAIVAIDFTAACRMFDRWADDKRKSIVDGSYPVQIVSVEREDIEVIPL